jgi:hypothetical protein
MKPERAPRATRKEPNLTPKQTDSYKAGSKLPDPAACPRCRATYLKGRWTWRAAPADAASHTCPACLRIEEDFPAGYVTLKGPFFAEHREEVLNLVNVRAQRAREDHPMQRVIGVADVSQGVLVTTTDAHLARGLAVAIHEAFKGNLTLNFSRDENLVRATWTR